MSEGDHTAFAAGSAARAARLLFMAMAGVLALAAVLAFMWSPLGQAEGPVADALFFAAAGLTGVAVIVAFFVQQRLPEAVASARSAPEAEDVVIRHAVFSLAAMEVPVWVALAGLLVTGDLSFLLFMPPFYIVLVVLFPTDARLGRHRMREPRLSTNGTGQNEAGRPQLRDGQ